MFRMEQAMQSLMLFILMLSLKVRWEQNIKTFLQSRRQFHLFILEEAKTYVMCAV